MSRIKSWFPRIPVILQHLEASPQTVYTRAEVEVLFIIGRSRANELMRIAGAETRNGAEATVSRDNLRWYVQRCPEAEAYIKEAARLDALAQQLRQTSEEKRQRAVKITGVQPSDEWTKWRDIPNIVFEPGVLRIAHSGQEDLIRTLWLMEKALANEPEEFAQLCGEAERAHPDTLEIGQAPPISEDELDRILRPATPEEIERLFAESTEDSAA